MKSRYYSLLVALVQVPFVMILAVHWWQGHENARWNEKPISPASFRNSVVPVVALQPSKSASPSQQRLQRVQRVAQVAGFKLRAVSPDGSRLLVEGSYHMALLLDARDGSITANLIKIFDCDWGNEQFSPDSRVVTFTQIRPGSTLRQFFSASTGEQLWSDTHTGDDILFSPNGKYLAIKRASRSNPTLSPCAKLPQAVTPRSVRAWD